MRQRIIINSTPQEARVALLENETLVEIHIERAQQRNLAGNIYKGKVARVLPGMQAAFIEVGIEKAGFIHVSDLFGGPLPSGFFEDDDPDDDTEPVMDEIPDEDAHGEHGEDDHAPTSEAARSGPPQRARRERFTPHTPLEDRIKKNQELLVQVTKEPIGTKGCRLTSHISLPGRHLVYTPTVSHIGVSRRIADSKERKRLRDIVQELRPPEGGFIVRTACEGLTKKEMHDDMRFLLKLWSGIAKKGESLSAPAVLHDDMDVILRIIRDLFTTDVEEVIIDTPQDYERAKEFVSSFLPRLVGRIKLHDRPEAIFDYYNIEPQIAKALDRRVYLKSGGHIVIDHTEALTAIDVNTGRFVGKRDQEETMLQTNLEAAKAVVEQLRLRNIGGLIIIDFIDMDRAGNRNKVTEALREALKQDKTRSSMRKISELGLVQMTRKRTRESLLRQLCDPCPYCEGKGYLRSVPTVASEILRQIRKEAFRHPAAPHLIVRAHPEVLTFLYDEEGERLDELEHFLRKRVFLRAAAEFHHEQHEIIATQSLSQSPAPAPVQMEEAPAPPPPVPPASSAPSAPRKTAGRPRRRR